MLPRHTPAPTWGVAPTAPQRIGSNIGETHFYLKVNRFRANRGQLGFEILSPESQGHIHTPAPTWGGAPAAPHPLREQQRFDEQGAT